VGASSFAHIQTPWPIRLRSLPSALSVGSGYSIQTHVELGMTSVGHLAATTYRLDSARVLSNPEKLPNGAPSWC
jgi:hypothetical protein